MPPNRDQQKIARIEKIREIVREDFERIHQARSPYDVLNVGRELPVGQIEERYERYERFYRAENFQRLGDIDLTRKALDIRRAIARAIVEVRDASRPGPPPPSDHRSHDEHLFTPEEDRRALAIIYFRDGLTYLQLGDLNEAHGMFKRCVEYDATSGLGHAYLGYITHKRRSYDPQSIDEARRLLERAAQLAPNEADVFVLIARFHARQSDAESLSATVDYIERIDPAHPMLDKLQRRLRRLRD